MAKGEITDAQFNKLVASVKKNPGESESFYVEATGIPRSQMLSALVRAEVEADPSLKIKPTGAAIVNAREREGLRWPRIAARTGKSIAEVQRLFEEHSGKSASESYTGRGRNFANGGGGGGRKSSGAGRKTATGRGTSGRRAAAKKTAAAPAAGRKAKTAGRGRGKVKTAGRSRTRADRKVNSADPQ